MGSTTRRIPQYSPSIELFGDWDKTRSLINGLDVTIKAGAILGQKSAAEKLKKIIKKNIRENGGSIGWPPVSDKYAIRKKSMGYDPNNLLVLTGLYYRNINTWYNGNTYYVGLKSKVRNPKTGGRLTLVQIANILEHGSVVRKIKARPLWRPSFKQFGGSARIKYLIVWHIRNLLRTKYGINVKINIT